MSEIELYTYPKCPYSQRVQIILHEKKIEYTKTSVKLRPAEDWFKKISPFGEVPALKIDNDVIIGSTIINEFLEERFPDNPMLPSALASRANARFWLNTCDNRLMSACHALIRDRRDEQKQVANRDRIDSELIHLNNQIAKSGGPYWMGRDFTLVDATFAPFIERYGCYQEVWGARWPAECTALKEWWDLVQQRESVAATTHDLDFHIDIYRGYDNAA